MDKKYFRRGTLVGFLMSMALLLVATGFYSKYGNINKKLSVIENVLDEYYVGDINKQKMEEGIYKGFVAGVKDPYTVYFTKEEFDDFKEKSSGVYAGIGVAMSIDQTDNTIVVTQVFRGSPAEAAGVLPKDKIIKAEETPLTGDDFELAPKIIKGKPGTKVKVTFYRPSEDKTLEKTIVRQNITTDTVEHSMMGDIGYIQITQFDEVTYDQFKKALDDVVAKGAKGLVIDLRNNGGGLLHITEQIADELLPKGLIVSTKDKNGATEEAYSDANFVDLPLVVLVNEQSASASEVLSGALKDHDRATLVGNRTFGKGIVQSLLPLSDGSAMKVTTSKYYTPSGVCIQGIGIEPDVKVELTPELMLKGKLEPSEDIQLQKALEVVKSKIK